MQKFDLIIIGAHIVMAIPLMLIPLAVISLEATRGTFLAFLVKLVSI